MTRAENVPKEVPGCGGSLLRFVGVCSGIGLLAVLALAPHPASGDPVPAPTRTPRLGIEMSSGPATPLP